MRKRLTIDRDKDRKVINLASTLKAAQDESKVYICAECGNDLVHDKAYCFRNPFGGEGYLCSNVGKCSMFGKVIDVSVVKPKVRPRPVKGAISNPRDANQELVIDFIPEDKTGGGLAAGLERDSYEKYDPEPGEDERMKMEGWHIIESRIELTDSSDQNKTLVKRIGQKPGILI